jgi:endonuclease/exonuclease/phosphatase family metal-dependent hydrolase
VYVPGVEKPLNIVPIHAYAFRYGRSIKGKTKAETDSLRKISAARYDGEYQRIKEFKYTIDHTVGKSQNPDEEYWMMVGDFNGYSRRDNYKYKYNDASLGFASQEFMNSHESPYYDVVSEMLPGAFQPSHKNTHRIDYVFATKALLNACAGVICPRDEFCKPRKVEGHKYCLPSDHSPIIVDFKISKLK